MRAVLHALGIKPAPAGSVDDTVQLAKDLVERWMTDMDLEDRPAPMLELTRWVLSR